MIRRAILALLLLPVMSACGTPSRALIEPLPRPVPAVLGKPCDGLDWVPPVGMDLEAAVIEMRGYLRLCNDDKMAGAALWTRPET